MAIDPVPFFVGQEGVRHSAEVVRASLYASTTGAEGISGITDLKVQAQPIPNNTVQVIPGGALMLNRYAGGKGQSYTFRNATATDVTITSTGSGGGRTDLIVARVFDTQYEGTPPVDVNDFQYSRFQVIQGVSAGVKTLKGLGITYPAVLLARVTIPANTATITNAMITDLRRIAQPRRDGDDVTVFPTGKWQQGTGQQIPSGNFGSWPITAAQRPVVYIPDWATHVNIVAHLSGVVYVKSSDNNQSVAAVRTAIGSAVPGQTGILVQDGTDAGNRMHYTVIGSHEIPEAMRGTDQYINIQGNKTGGTGRWYGDDQTSVILEWKFSERAH